MTDPICSHCWAIEPVLHRFVTQYGEYFNFQTVMGGLLEKWHDGPIDPANGIYKPADVAGHWREVKQQPSLSNLLEKEKLLLSKEIEVMYDIEQSDVNSFIEKELSPDSFQMKEILGEFYFIKR